MSSPNVLEVKDLTKTYGKGENRITAVQNLNLSVEKGQVYGVLGPNGAGKTTTIKMICGMMRPDSGTIHIEGHPLISGQTQNNRLATGAIGVCPQELVLWRGLTLLEQMVFVGRMYDLPKNVALERACGLIEAMGLTDKRDQLGDSLSGGMKRRVNIILALMNDPALLILDEPQAGLDPQSRVLVRDYISRLSKHKTVLITTHDMEEADKICDRVAIIDHGRLLIENTPGSLKADMFKSDLVEFEVDGPTLPHTELLTHWQSLYGRVNRVGNTVRFQTDQPMALIESVQEQMRKAHLNVADIKIRKASLEDVFIELTGRGLRE